MRSLTIFFISLLLVSCGSDKKAQENSESEKLVVAAVNYPLYSFAQGIGGEFIQLEFPIPADIDPAYWAPDDEALSVYQLADIILANGADYAKWMKNVSLATSRIHNTTRTSEEKYIKLKETSTHSHGLDGEHEHTGYAFTTWLDFEMAIAQAEAVKDILLSKLPENKNELIENYTALESDLISLHESMKSVSNLLGNQTVIGSHPVYQYLAQAYGLNIQSVHFEPDVMPSEKQWIEFDHLLEHFLSSIMLWEDEPVSEIKEKLQKKGIQVVVFNPCGNMPEQGNFIETMNENIKTLEDILKQ
jgi:zinc transport system substrate-binding protein